MSNTRFKDTTEIEKYIRDEISRTVWIMDNNTLRIGNDEAFTFVEDMEMRMTRLEKELAKQKEKTAEQAKELAEQANELAEQKEKATGRNMLLWKIRLSELERIIKKTRNPARFERNEMIHGADVFNDYQALEHALRLGNQAQFKTASNGFKRAYGLSPRSLSHGDLLKAPEATIDILNFRGNLTFLNWFFNHKEEAYMIEKECDSAVAKWRKSMWRDGVPYPKDAAEADHNRVKELYDRVREQEVWH